MVSRVDINLSPRRLSNCANVVLCSGKLRFAIINLINPFGSKRVSGQINLFGKTIKVELFDEGDAIHFHNDSIGIQFIGFSKESTEENMIPTIQVSFASDANYRITAIPEEQIDSIT